MKRRIPAGRELSQALAAALDNPTGPRCFLLHGHISDRYPLGRELVSLEALIGNTCRARLPFAVYSPVEEFAKTQDAALVARLRGARAQQQSTAKAKLETLKKSLGAAGEASPFLTIPDAHLRMAAELRTGKPLALLIDDVNPCGGHPTVVGFLREATRGHGAVAQGSALFLVVYDRRAYLDFVGAPGPGTIEIEIAPPCTADITERLEILKALRPEAFDGFSPGTLAQDFAGCSLMEVDTVVSEVAGQKQKVTPRTVGVALHLRPPLPSREEIVAAGRVVRGRLFGQERAVVAVEDALQKMSRGSRASKRVTCILLLGPTAVGKSAIGDEWAAALNLGPGGLIRIGFDRATHGSNSSTLYGAPPGFVGSDQEHLAAFSKIRPGLMFMCIDEIEKGADEMLDSLLTTIEDGKATLTSNTTKDLTNVVILLTSNEGAELAEQLSDSVEREEAYVLAAQARFRPEFLSRVDHIVVLNRLDAEACAKLANRSINDIADRMSRTSGVAVKVSDAARKSLCATACDQARAQNARAIQNAVESMLNKCMADCPGDGQPILIDVDAAGRLVVKGGSHGRA